MSMPPSALTIMTMLLRGAIDDHAEIQLAIDREPFLDQQAADDLSRRAGLVGDQRLPEQRCGDRLGLVGAVGDLDAAGLAAAAGVNLRLDHDRRRRRDGRRCRRPPAAENATSPRGTGTP